MPAFWKEGHGISDRSTSSFVSEPCLTRPARCRVQGAGCRARRRGAGPGAGCRARPAREGAHRSLWAGAGRGARQEHSLTVLKVFWMSGADSNAGILPLRHGACAKNGTRSGWASERTNGLLGAQGSMEEIPCRHYPRCRHLCHHPGHHPGPRHRWQRSPRPPSPRPRPPTAIPAPLANAPIASKFTAATSIAAPGWRALRILCAPHRRAPRRRQGS